MAVNLALLAVQVGLGLGCYILGQTVENAGAVGAEGATLLDLVELLPEEKRKLPYHFFGDNFFSSMKLIDELTASSYFYTGTIRKDRLKGNPTLTALEQFKKTKRG
jgi:hypothetical protein